MKLAFFIILAVSGLAFLLMLFTGQQPVSTESPSMPWQVTVHDPDHSEVFGIVLNRTRLDQAVERFGRLEGISLYRNSEDRYNLEAYFGKISSGPLSARVIANLQADQQELETLGQQVTKRTSTETGSMKWILSDQQQQAQLQRVIRALTYIPDYKGMDEAYLVQRFGEPQRRQKIDDSSEFWFYADPGVRILVDKEGREVFEYIAPAQFFTLTGDQQ